MFLTAAIVVTQCEYHKNEWFVNPAVPVFIVVRQDHGQ